MATNLIFDFFGTLVRYSDGTFNGERYSLTHQVLLDRGFSLDYDVMVSRLDAAFQELDAQARVTLIEYHIHDAGRLFFSECFGAAPADEVVAQFIETFNHEWNRGTIFYPEIKPFLETLAQRYRLSIISNSVYPPLVPNCLEAMGVVHHFAQVLTSAEFGFRKPDQRIFQEALARLRTDATQAIYVGDSFEADYKGATDAGLRCILIDPDRKWQNVVNDRVDSLFDLADLLELEQAGPKEERPR